MRKVLLSTVSALTLAIGGAAYAQETESDANANADAQVEVGAEAGTDSGTEVGGTDEEITAEQESEVDATAEADVDGDADTEGLVEDTTDTIGEAAEDTGEAIEDTAEAAEDAADDAMGTTAETSTEAGASTMSANDFTAEELMGASVIGVEGDSIAEVNDLVIGSSDNQVTHVLLDVGGFLGIGSKLVALPIEDVQIVKQDGAVFIETTNTEDDLEQMAEFEAEADQRLQSEMSTDM